VSENELPLDPAPGRSMKRLLNGVRRFRDEAFAEHSELFA